MQPGEVQLKTWMLEGLDGDAASHAALLRALVPLLRAFYRRRVGDRDAIEDLVQETLIAVHTRRMSFDRKRSFSPWLFAVARYKMIDHFRRARHTWCPKALRMRSAPGWTSTG
jgi:DNA-directed RNA polymerase specialized sigma24 family protein